ncbi:MAG: hypothetical protein V3T70_07510, partial [Phycisphaerae bacterium]
LGPGNVGGRIRAIVIHPDEPNIMWVGSVSGGIWTTSDSGDKWRLVSGFAANLAVSCMIMDPTNTNVLYAGTGEGFGNSDALPGAGVFRSMDGGATWSQVPGTVPTSPGTADPWSFVNRLAIAPNGLTLFAAANSGIWRGTLDPSSGGWTWNRQTTTKAVDIKMDPNDATAMRLLAGKTNGQALYTTDAGTNWTGAGMTPNPGSGRVELAYAKTNPSGKNVVFASVNINQGDVYRSTDGGQTFTRVNTGNSYLKEQGWYDNVIWVDPSEATAQRFIVGGIDLWRSILASGFQMAKISDWRVSTSAHADHHAIVEHPQFDGSTETTIFFGNDGGIYKSTDATTAIANTVSYTRLNNSLGITQFYGAAVNSNGMILGGAQDNGTLRLGSIQGINDWSEAAGGDGGIVASDSSDANIFYGEFTHAEVFHYDVSAGAATEIHSLSTNNKLLDASSKTEANFIAPLMLDPHDSSVLLVGTRRLWRSKNPKAAAPDWFAISPSRNRNVSAIDVAAGSSNIIWVGHGDFESTHTGSRGEVYLTINGAAADASTITWNKMDTLGTTPLPNNWVSDITIDPNDRTRVYVTFPVYASNTVWRGVADYAATPPTVLWTKITGPGSPGDPTTLPAAPVMSIAVHPNPALPWLYVGTDVGVFVSEDDGQNWMIADAELINGDGPANVAVDQLFFAGDRILYAATHGRGIYRIDTRPDLIGLATVRASVDSNEVQGDMLSLDPEISGDGQYIAFESVATNLVDGDTNGKTDIFVRDRVAGTTVRVSVTSAGAQVTDIGSVNPTISMDGRYVAFDSASAQLASNANGFRQVYVHDRDANTNGTFDQPGGIATTIVSVNSGDVLADRDCAFPAFVGNGRWIVFQSRAGNLNGSNNGFTQIFLHNRDSDSNNIFDEPGSTETFRVSLDGNGDPANQDCAFARVAGDGRYIAFETPADLTPTDVNTNAIYVRDVALGKTVLTSVDSSGTPFSSVGQLADLSSDGRFVVFRSGLRIYVHDRDANTNGVFDEPGAIATTGVDKSSDGVLGNGSSDKPAISGNGRFAVFASNATNLVPGDTNDRRDAFLHDRDSDTNGVFDEPGGIATERISVNSDGQQGIVPSGPGIPGAGSKPSVTADGQIVCFLSDANN